MKVIDNFLPEEYFKQLHDIMMGNEFPWFYNDNITYAPDGTPDPGYQFIHTFFKTQGAYYNSDTFHILSPLLGHMNVKNLYRLKANQNPVDGGKQLGRYHTDVDIQNSLTSVFYVNTNDGYTKFEDGTIVESVENRLLTFDSQMKHVGVGCTNYKRRVLININYSVAT